MSFLLGMLIHYKSTFAGHKSLYNYIEKTKEVIRWLGFWVFRCLARCVKVLFCNILT